MAAMKALFGGLALGLALGGSASAQSPSTPFDPVGVTVAETAAWLKAAGYEAEISTNEVGRPVIFSAIGKAKFDVLFFDCEGDRCGSLQFAAAFKLKIPPADEVVNRWNRTNRYLKAYSANDGATHVQYDVNVNVGRTPAMLSDDFGVWVANFPKFPAFIGF